MLKDFKEQYEELEKTKEFTEFKQTNPNYYLAHGFAQLNNKFEPTKDWQIGYYSKENDHLAIFDMNDLKEPQFDEAFKDGGVIDELKVEEEQISVHQALEKSKSLLEEKYLGELIMNVLVIFQTINNEPTYNLTFITQTFAMITLHISAKTGDVVKEIKNSVLDLKKQ